MATSRLAAAGAMKGAFEDLMTTEDGIAAHTAGHAAMGSAGTLITPHAKSKFMLPFNQSGNNTVLPRDYASGANVTFGAGVGLSQPWATAGYMTLAAGSNNCVIVPNANFAFNMNTDSMILFGTIKMAAPTGSAKNIMVCHDGASNHGFALSVSLTGKLALVVHADSTVTSSYSTATVADSADHVIAVCMDGPAKTAYIYVDGVLDITSASLWAASTNATIASDLYFGQSIAGLGIAASYKGFQELVFEDSSLPINTAELVTIAKTKTRTGISAGDAVFM